MGLQARQRQITLSRISGQSLYQDRPALQTESTHSLKLGKCTKAVQVHIPHSLTTQALCSQITRRTLNK